MKKTFTNLLLFAIVISSFSCWNVDIVKPPEIPDVSFPTIGLIAYYPFSYSVNDASGNGYNGIFYNTIWYTQDRFGTNSNSYYVKSSNNNGYIDLPASISITSSFSVSFWIKTGMTKNASFDAACYLIDRNISGFYYDWSLRYGEGKRILFNTGSNSANYTLMSTVDVGDNNWHHICAVFNDSLSSKQLYIDGILRGQVSFSGGTFENNNIPITVGYPTGFEGAIDDIRLYNRALSLEESNLLYIENGWGLKK